MEENAGVEYGITRALEPVPARHISRTATVYQLTWTSIGSSVYSDSQLRIFVLMAVMYREGPGAGDPACHTSHAYLSAIYTLTET